MEKTEIIIKKAKLTKSGNVETTYIDADGNTITMAGKNKCHHDMKVAFARLVPFFADLTEQKEAEKIDWSDIECTENIELLRKIDVTGIGICGDDNNQTVTMTGRRTLITSRVLNLNAPAVEMDSDTFEWNHINEFDVALQGLVYEVKAYICDRKWFEETNLFSDSDGNADDPFAGPQPTDEVPDIETTAKVDTPVAEKTKRKTKTAA